MSKEEKIRIAQRVLRDLGMDDERSNKRSAMVLLALAGIAPSSLWSEATNDMYGTRAIMDWIKDEYDVAYAANTRETIRRFILHQFVEGGLVEENADDPSRPVNSPIWNYRINDFVLEALQHADKTEEYAYCITEFNSEIEAWRDHYTAEPCSTVPWNGHAKRSTNAFFPTRKVMQRFLSELAWETEAWCADSPDHMIHLDGERFLGPYNG